MAEKQRKIALRVQELESEGVQWAQFKAMKEFLTKEIEENKKNNAQFSRNLSSAGSKMNIFNGTFNKWQNIKKCSII